MDLLCRSEAAMLRVVQWATGAVGRHAVATMADHPDLEVVGALVYSDHKAARVLRWPGPFAEAREQNTTASGPPTTFS
jgi:hypothetical protein